MNTFTLVTSSYGGKGSPQRRLEYFAIVLNYGIFFIFKNQVFFRISPSKLQLNEMIYCGEWRLQNLALFKNIFHK
jgi:hypothetical protein